MRIPLNGSAEKLVSLLPPQSPVAEAYRILRTNIQFLSLDRPIHTIAFTSAGPSEGKTLTVANLGLTMAQSGGRVTLIDCDLRRPALHRVFHADNARGLTSVLLGEYSIKQVGQSTGMDNLTLIPSGPLPPNPAELLGSERMRHLTRTLAEQNEMVIFDCPPVLAVADAAILASYVDGVIIVVSSGSVSPQAAQRVKTALGAAKANILGTVLNRAQPGGGDSDYYRYYRR